MLLVSGKRSLSTNILRDIGDKINAFNFQNSFGLLIYRWATKADEYA